MDIFRNRLINYMFVPIILLLTIPVGPSYSMDNDVFSIRLVHQENDKLIESESKIRTTNLVGYQKFTMTPQDYPSIVWVSDKNEIDISDLESAFVYYTEPLMSKEEFNYDKKQNPELFEDPRFEKQFDEVFIEAGQPQVHIQLNSKGTKKFEEFTSNFLKRRTAIFLDGRLLSAPLIVKPIQSGFIGLCGPYKDSEAEKIVERINYLVSSKSKQ